MRAIKYRELKRMYDADGPQKTVRHLSEALAEGHLKAEDFFERVVRVLRSYSSLGRPTVDPEELDALAEVLGKADTLLSDE